MKYITILCDGMADTPVESLGGKTPLMVANTPNMDFLASFGEVGIAKTVPDGMAPGSDVANLSAIGYDPKLYYTGRSPLEAVSMGINLNDDDVTLRANLVTLSDAENYENKTMVDYSSDEITTEESHNLIEYLKENLDTDKFTLYPGISYRHCLVFKGGAANKFNLTPPHDISDRCIKKYLPAGNCKDELLSIMKRSNDLLPHHSVNVDRCNRGLHPATSLWLWGSGTKPSLPSFQKKRGLKAAVITAVDLIKGIAICAGMDVINVPGATGNINTDFDGKAAAAINALRGDYDFVFLHMEAADECGHRGETENKIKAIELMDSKVVGPILREFNKDRSEDLRILLMPDHPTPISTKTHSRESVPYIIFDNTNRIKGIEKYNEQSAVTTGNVVTKGFMLADKLFAKN